MFELVNDYSVTETRRIAKEEERKEVIIEFVKKLLKRNRPIEEIIEDTDLTREKIENPRHEIE